MIDIDAEFRNIIGLSSGTQNTPVPSEPLTIEKLRAAAAKVGLPEWLEVSKSTNLVEHLNLIDAGGYITSDPFGMGFKSIAGIEVRYSETIPPDVIVLSRAGEIVKIIALTEDAKRSAQALASMVEAAKSGLLRDFSAILIDIWYPFLVVFPTRCGAICSNL